MGNVRIGLLQSFALTLLFELGTALVVNLGGEAGRDAWMAVLIGSLVGLIPFVGYVYLYRTFPDEPLTGYARKLLGKYLGSVVAMLYIILFINAASRDLRDGSTMLAISTMHRTPIFILSVLMVLSCAYVAHKGVEVLARTALLYALIVVIIGVFITIMLFFSDAIELTRLVPVLGDGITPVIRSVLRQNYMFPFGEMICFTMLMPHLSDKKKGPWILGIGILVSGLFLSCTVALNISVLGADIVRRSPLPLMPTVGKISISDFIQRLDVLVVMVLIIGVFFKITVFYIAALIGISDLFGLPYRRMVYPVALIILFTSMLEARSFVEHLEEGQRLLYTVFPYYTLAIPALLVVICAIRRHRSAPRPG